jgi:hypothetical protein
MARELIINKDEFLNKLLSASMDVGATSSDLEKLCEKDILAYILPVVRGHADVVTHKHVICCDVMPPNTYYNRVEKHLKLGNLEWDSNKVKLYVRKEQNGKDVSAIEIDKEMNELLALNVNVLDYLIAHPALIPEDWKKNNVYFWGTILSEHDEEEFEFNGSVFVPYLYFSELGDTWQKGLHYLFCDYLWPYGKFKFDWDEKHPAAVLAY